MNAFETYISNITRLYGGFGADLHHHIDDFYINQDAMEKRAKTFVFHRDTFIRRLNNKVRSWNTPYPTHLPHYRRNTTMEAILKAHLKTPSMVTLAALWDSRVVATQIGGTLSRDYFAYKDALNKLSYSDLPEAWKDQSRFQDFWYQYLPHQSATDNTRVAYVQSYNKFIRPGKDEPLYTVTSPAKFWTLLNETHDLNLAEHEIRDLGAAWTNHFSASSLFIAKGEDKIIDVIFEGPSESCQSRGYGFRPEGHIHPAACFDTPDFTVLYITEDNTPSGRVTGRLIANASTKEAARPYGNVDRMTRAAEAAGYKLKPLALVGCRLKKIEDDNDSGRYIMPYVDAGIASGGGSLHAKDQGDYFILQNTRGDYCTHECGYGNNGVTEDSGSRYTCSDCGCRVDEDDCRTNDYGDCYCDDCYNERYVYAYNSTLNRNCQDDCNRDDCIEFNGYWYLNDDEVLALHGIYKCAECDELFKEDDLYHCEDGLRCSDHATPLSDEFYSDADYHYADPDLTVETSAGETILDDDAVEINCQVYHKDEEVTMTAEDFQELITKARKQGQLAATTATVITDAARLNNQLRSEA